LLKHRVLAAIGGVPLILYITYLGGYYYFGLVLLITAVGLMEYLTMVKTGDFVLPAPVPLSAALVILGVQFLRPEFFSLALVLTALLFALLSVLYFPRLKPWELMTAIWGIIYIAGFLSYLLLLRAMEQGFTLSLFLFIGIWANDSGAYFCGLSLGKRKLAPLLSPKKTVEGAVGGIISTLAVLLIFAAFTKLDLLMAFAAALLISLAGMAGDLAVSALKRHFQVKDTGKIIPGHGGFLDRFDSLIFTAPLLYTLLLLFL
jgi:phosphatidate cytidylyltransferase